MAVIAVKNISKSFGTKVALNDISFAVEQGKICGFLGPNGAGKTTTIRLMMDFIRADTGSISIFDLDSRVENAKLKKAVGYSSSDLELYNDWTGEEHLAFFQNIKGKTALIKDLIKRLDLDLKPKVCQLSSGNKQKLALLLAFVGNPKLLIMDEPTRGLDPLLQNTFYQILREFKNAGGTIFLSSHNLDEVQKICDSVIVIREGKLVALESMDAIREMGVHVISLTTIQPLRLTDFKSVGVKVISHDRNTIILKAHGDINKILKTINHYQVKDIEITHLSLEEVFTELYRG